MTVGGPVIPDGIGTKRRRDHRHVRSAVECSEEKVLPKYAYIWVNMTKMGFTEMRRAE